MQPVKPVSDYEIKAEIIGLTLNLATNWADKNVRCDALSQAGDDNGQSEIFVQHLSSLILPRRMVKKDEYRAAIQFFFLEVTSYINGRNLLMDVGRSAC